MRLNCQNRMAVNYFNIPSSQIIPLNYDSSGFGFIANLSVLLTQPWKRCFKIGSGSPTASTYVNNIFLHFYSITRNDAVFGNSAGLLSVAGNLPNAWPLENRLTNNRMNWKFKNGLPMTVLLSADYQGDGTHTDLVCFCNDDINMDEIKPI